MPSSIRWCQANAEAQIRAEIAKTPEALVNVLDWQDDLSPSRIGCKSPR